MSASPPALGDTLRALRKAREGDLVRFQSPAGWREVEVLSIEYKAIDDEPSSC